MPTRIPSEVQLSKCHSPKRNPKTSVRQLVVQWKNPNYLPQMIQQISLMTKTAHSLTRITLFSKIPISILLKMTKSSLIKSNWFLLPGKNQSNKITISRNPFLILQIKLILLHFNNKNNKWLTISLKMTFPLMETEEMYVK